MRILQLSLRNTGRNRQRTAVTVLPMAFACAIMILFSSMIQGSERKIVEMNMGDIQIHPQGYPDDPDIYKSITNTAHILQQLAQQGIKAAPRLYTFGLLATHGTSSSAHIRGIDMQRKKTVTKLYQHVAVGSWLDEAKPNTVVLGKKIAATLGVNTGDELVFVGQSADGFMANDIFYVQGVLKAVSDGIDRSAVFMTEQTFRELMAVPSGTHEIVLRRPSPQTDLTKITTQVQKLVPEYEVKNWKELMPAIVRNKDTQNRPDRTTRKVPLSRQAIATLSRIGIKNQVECFHTHTQTT